MFVQFLLILNVEYVLNLHFVKTLWLQLAWMNEQNIAHSERDSRVTTRCLHPSCPVNYLHVSGAFTYIPSDNCCSTTIFDELILSFNRLNCQYCFEDCLPHSWWNLWTSKQKTDIHTTMPDTKRGEASPRCGSRHLHASSPHGIPSGCWENLCCAMMGNRGIWLRSLWLLVGCGYTPFAAAPNRFLQGNAWASISFSASINNLSYHTISLKLYHITWED